MAPGVRGENKPTRDGKTVREKMTGRKAAAVVVVVLVMVVVVCVQCRGGGIFGCKPAFKASRCGSGVCVCVRESPRSFGLKKINYYDYLVYLVFTRGCKESVTPREKVCVNAS